MNQLDKPIAACVADLHLSAKAPTARSAERDWLKAQARQLDQLRKLVTSPTGEQKIPVLAAGDVFDRWHAAPEVVNVALAHLPHLHAVFGNHDLPNHDPKQLQRSAFWTLVKAGKVTLLGDGRPFEISSPRQPLRVWGFGYGCPPTPLAEPHDMYLEVALVHAFVWNKKLNTGHAAASEEQTTGAYRAALRGYDVAIFGDNHTPFEVTKTIRPDDDAPENLDLRYWSKQLLFNCGGYFRRRINEIDHRPSVGLLHADGTIERHYLNCENDKFVDGADLKALTDTVDYQAFIESLAELGDQAMDFAAAVRQTLDREKVPQTVRQLILTALEGNK